MSWAILPSPNSETVRSSVLNSVGCMSASACWAVGYRIDGDVRYGGNTQTLIEQWDGSTWSIVASPNTDGGVNELNSISCGASSECWAVGRSYNDAYRTLIEKWDGSSWTIVPSPNTNDYQGNYLFGSTCASDSHCWAVGSSVTTPRRTLVEEWNGSAWRIVSSPNAAPDKSSSLIGVTCASASECWAVGDYNVDSGATTQTFIARYLAPFGAQCTDPFLQVEAQGSAPVGGDTTGELQIQSVNVGEPFDGDCNEKSTTFVMKVSTMDPAHVGEVSPLPDTQWHMQFVIPGEANSTGQPLTIFVFYDTTLVPTGAFNYGFVDNNETTGIRIYTPQCTELSPTESCAATGRVSVDGTILLKLKSPFVLTPLSGPPIEVDLHRGTELQSIQGLVLTRTAWSQGVGHIVYSQTTADGIYRLQGNAACSTKIPLARLTANPISGYSPLRVNFDASESVETIGACGIINAWTIDFGDGSTPVTQNTPTFSHTYSTAGTYQARLLVSDTAGLTSINPAQANIDAQGHPVSLVGMTSRKMYDGIGAFDVDLAVSTESRGGDPNQNYELVFTFSEPVTNVAAAEVSNAGVTITNRQVGSDPHEYIVDVMGVANAQTLTVRLTNVSDAAGDFSPIIAGSMRLLIGDTNGDGFVNSADIAQTKSQSGQSVTESNFREDVNTDYNLNSADIALVKSRSGTALQ
jgi:PKD repeat protein